MNSVAVTSTPEPLELLNVKRYLTTDEVATILNIPKSTVYQAAKENRVGGLVRFGRKVRFDPGKLRQWLDEGGTDLPGGWRKEAQ